MERCSHTQQSQVQCRERPYQLKVYIFKRDALSRAVDESAVGVEVPPKICKQAARWQDKGLSGICRELDPVVAQESAAVSCVATHAKQRVETVSSKTVEHTDVQHDAERISTGPAFAEDLVTFFGQGATLCCTEQSTGAHATDGNPRYFGGREGS